VVVAARIRAGARFVAARTRARTRAPDGTPNHPARAPLRARRGWAPRLIAASIRAASDRGRARSATRTREACRAAATARVPASRRLRERLQFRAASAVAPRSRKPVVEPADAPVAAVSGNGIVLVGTSTGGPPALEALLSPLSAHFSWPIVVAQHMPAAFTGPLARRLDGICSLNVLEVTGPTQLRPGCAYVGRGDADIVISKRPAGLIVMSVPAKADYPWHPSTDRLVRSAMEYLPATQLIGVLMTGMGDDGAEAMTILRAGGGTTIAEAEETAVVWGMPGELTRAGGATFVLPLPKISRRLQKLVPDAAHT